MFSVGAVNWYDNMHYQYQQGYVDQDFYESAFKGGVRVHGPLWVKWNHLRGMRQAFRDEVEEILGMA